MLRKLVIAMAKMGTYSYFIVFMADGKVCNAEIKYGKRIENTDDILKIEGRIESDLKATEVVVLNYKLFGKE